MATKQDFLDLEGSRIEMGEIIVTTMHGDVIAARLGPDDTLELTTHGVKIAAELDGEAAPTEVKRKRKLSAAVVAPDAEAAPAAPATVTA